MNAEQKPAIQLTVSKNGDRIVPDGMMLISIAEYNRIRQLLIQFQQAINPVFGLDRLETGRQKRRNARG